MRQPDAPAAFQSSSQFGYAPVPSSAGQQQAAGQQYAAFGADQQHPYGYAQAVASPPAQATGGAVEAAPHSNSEIPVGSVLGIPVRVHVLLPAVTVLYTLNAWLISTSAAVFMFILTGPVLYGSVLLHELGHCVAARRMGGAVDGILLWPLGGLAYIAHSGAPKEDLVIAAAGPLTHGPQAAVWGILYAIARASQSYGWIWLCRLCSAALKMQLSLLVFNLLSPAYPLDGGRILVDLLSMRGLALDSAARVAAFLSFLTGLGICVYALASGALLTLPVGVWVLVQAWELVQKVRRGEAHTHPMFLHYASNQQNAAAPAQLV